MNNLSSPIAFFPFKAKESLDFILHNNFDSKDEQVLQTFCKHISCLWNDDGIQACYKELNKPVSNDSVK